MRIGILDTKVNGQQIDNIDLYKSKGYEIINSKHLDDGKKFDIVASTWTRLNEKRIRLAGIKGIVIKDNDEPDNVVDVELLKRLKVPYGLIGLWGISTRVAWNLERMRLSSKLRIGNHALMIANTPSHDVIKTELEQRGIIVAYPVTPKENKLGDIKELLEVSDIVITHLGKEDFPRYWLDQYLPFFKQRVLYISTTRGPLYHAAALNTAVRKNEITAVLDWAWEEDKIIESDKIIHTGHSSYRSEQSATELAKEVIKSVEAMKRKLSK